MENYKIGVDMIDQIMNSVKNKVQDVRIQVHKDDAHDVLRQLKSEIGLLIDAADVIAILMVKEKDAIVNCYKEEDRHEESNGR